MNRTIVVSAPAARQIRDEATWWRKQRVHAPDLLRAELARAFRLLTEQPLAGAEVDDMDLAGV